MGVNMKCKNWHSDPPGGLKTECPAGETDAIKSKKKKFKKSKLGFETVREETSHFKHFYLHRAVIIIVVIMMQNRPQWYQVSGIA